jgi:hypothetical protein
MVGSGVRGRYPGAVTTRSSLARGAWRALALATPALAGVLLLAGPASAVPEGWSDPDPVSGLQALTVFVFAPAAVLAVTAALALLPRWAGAARSAPVVTATESTTGLDEMLEAERPEELEAASDDD